MLTKPTFAPLLQEWYRLNAILILNDSLPEMERTHLLINRRFYSELFSIMDGVIYDDINK